MRILFVKPKHIGDSLILTPTIQATRKAYPDAKISVVVRRGCEGILQGCPAIDQIFTMAPVERSDRSRADTIAELKLLARLSISKFDYVFELGDGHRARLLTLLSRGRKKFSVKPTSKLGWIERKQFSGISKFDWEKCHRVEKDFYSVHEFLPLSLPIPPVVFDKSQTKRWSTAETLTDFAMMHVGSRQKFNRWTRDGWLNVGKHLLNRFPNLILCTGPNTDEIEEAKWLSSELGNRAICTLGKTNWAEYADLLYRARLFVSINTAAMHLAAACQCPTVALFGPSLEDHWHPWQSPHQVVTSRGFKRDEQNPFPDMKRRIMQDIHFNDVIEACEKIARNN
jgi:heptosyltransferase-3